MPLEFGKLATEQAPLFDGSKLIWAGLFIVISIIFSIMTWRAQRGLTVSGQRSRSLMYWAMNVILFCIGIYFVTRTFPRLPAGWVLAGLLIFIFAVSGMTAVTKSKVGGDKKEGDTEKK